MPIRARTSANYFADAQRREDTTGLDDSGAYGIGIATAFEHQAAKKGITVMGHDRLDPKAADYTTVLTKIKALNPQLIYYGGDAQAGVKLIKQSYDIVPNMLKAGGDGAMVRQSCRAPVSVGKRLVCHRRQSAHD